MALERLDHYSIRTDKLEATRDFYVDVLGLTEGYRPSFGFPGHWLYCGDRAVVHLIGADPSGSQGVSDFLGDRNTDELSGAGALDHIAFRATELERLRVVLDEHQINCSERTIFDLDLHLVIIQDPNGITIELNYEAGEVAAC